MPEFCDVALPVPLEASFTYRLNGTTPVIGGRVIVPFREQRLSGIVVALHDTPPKVAARNVLTVLDASPVLDAELLKLGRWISDYYVAPLGEVFRAMLPLGAEFRRARGYRLTERGMEALHNAATRGARYIQSDADHPIARSPDHPIEFAVLDHLPDRDIVREESLRSSTGASRTALNMLVRRKWIDRRNLSAARDAARTMRVAMLMNPWGRVAPRPAQAAPSMPTRTRCLMPFAMPAENWRSSSSTGFPSRVRR